MFSLRSLLVASLLSATPSWGAPFFVHLEETWGTVGAYYSVVATDLGAAPASSVELFSINRTRNEFSPPIFAKQIEAALNANRTTVPALQAMARTNIRPTRLAELGALDPAGNVFGVHPFPVFVTLRETYGTVGEYYSIMAMLPPTPARLRAIRPCVLARRTFRSAIFVSFSMRPCLAGVYAPCFVDNPHERRHPPSGKDFRYRHEELVCSPRNGDGAVSRLQRL
jgi:hypothetical protein